MRSILKVILEFLSKVTIKKHNIQFIIVVGWYGTELVKEGIYSILSEKYIVRRNTKSIWWDLSIPLVILGYEDKKYSVFGWINIFFRSIFALFLNPVNPHKIIINLNLAEKNTSEFWSRIITPELLIITSNKEGKSFIIHSLTQGLLEDKKCIFISNDISEDIFMKYKKFGVGDNGQLITPSGLNYTISESFPKIYSKIFPAVITALEYFNYEKEDILSGLLTINASDLLTDKIVENLKSKNEV